MERKGGLWSTASEEETTRGLGANSNRVHELEG